MTFSKACEHMTNYTSAHESAHESARLCAIGGQGIKGYLANPPDYPDNHVEIDNRLTWFLGSLNKAYPGAYYVHLIRKRADVVRSLEKRVNRFGVGGIIGAYGCGMLYKKPREVQNEIREIAGHYYDTVNATIRDFQANTRIQMEDPKNMFTRFWAKIGADGDLAAALKEWDIRYNALPEEG